MNLPYFSPYARFSYEISINTILDSHMQVNHIAQFHLAMILLPILQKTPNSRLVLQSSELHRPISDVKFESLAELNRDIGPTKLYNRTKLAQILFMQALCRRAERGELGFKGANETGPWIISVHPGGVLTDQQGQAIEAYGTMAKLGVAAMKPLLKDPVEGGCRPALFAATHEDVVKDKLQGKYVSFSKVLCSCFACSCLRRKLMIERKTDCT